MVIKKKTYFLGILICFLLVAFLSGVHAEALTGEVSGVDVSGYAEVAGEYLLKFQEIFMSVLTSLSFGVFGGGGADAFAQFLLMVVVFILVYGFMDFLSFIPKKFNFVFSLAVTILAFLFMDIGNIQMMLSNYESLGIIITVILPVLIILAFTFRMYHKAYEGKSNNSPFFVEMFNLIFLIFFGIFFMRHSYSETGGIASLRYFSGWFLIVMGFAQLLLFRILVKILFKWKKEGKKMKTEIKDMREKISEETRKAREKAELGAS